MASGQGGVGRCLSDDVFLGESVDQMWCAGGRQVALVLTLASLASKLKHMA